MSVDNELLKRIINHTYETVPFYHSLIDSDKLADIMEVTDLPVIDKRKIIESGESMMSSRYMGKYISNQLKWTRTSGSSGLLYEIYWDGNDEKRSLKNLWLLRWKYYKISPRHRVCYFFPSDIAVEKYIERGNSFAVSRSVLYDGDLMEAYQRIKNYKPEWMILQPGIALILCDLADKYGAWEGVKYIEFTGEFLETSVRKRVESVFGCQTANQYGIKEVNSIAYECPKGNMHVMSDNVYLESVEGNLCVTSLQNYAMPFVRYRLEDRGEITRNVACECGKCGDVLTLHQGRTNDRIKLSNGDTVHAYALMQIIHHINYRYDGCIIQYQIVQEDYTHFVFYVVLDEEDCDEETGLAVLQEIRNKVRARMGDEYNCDVRFIKGILPEERTGKCKVFTSHVI